MNQITRRNVLKASAFLSVTSVAISNETIYTPAQAISLSDDARQQVMLEGIRQKEIYLPTPDEALALSGSQEEAFLADRALKSLSASDLKINLQTKAEQDILTEQYRAEYLASLNTTKSTPSATAYAVPKTNALHLQDPHGRTNAYLYNGVQNVIAPMVQAWRPNYSKGRIHASYDPVNGTTWWSVWRSTDSDWHYLPKKAASTSGTYYWCAVNQVEKYDSPM